MRREIKLADKSKMPIITGLTALIIASVLLFAHLNTRGGFSRREIIGNSTNPADSNVMNLKAHTRMPSPTPASARKINKKALEKALREESEKFPGFLSVAVYDFNSDTLVEIEAGEVMESASLVKLPIMMEAFRCVNEGKLDLHKTVELQESHKAGGSGKLKNKKAGASVTVQKLTELMIVESDNTAANMMTELLGMEPVEKTCIAIGMKNTTMKRKIYDFDMIDKGFDNLTTARDMTLFFRTLYEGSFAGPKESAEMLNILKRQTRNHLIPKLLPKEVQCAHKTGGLQGVVHDCGIVYPPGGSPYIAVLMSKNVTGEKQAEEALSRISLKIYNYLK